MAIVLKLPKLGVTIEEATLAEWLVEDGAAVEEGTPIYVLETDKASQEMESPIAGKIEFIAEVGRVYEVGDPIARIV